MESNQEKEDIADKLPLTPFRVFMGMIVLEILLIFFAFIQPSGGMWEGGFGVIFGSKVIQQAHLQSAITAGINGIITLVVMGILIFMRENEYVQKFAILLTIIFGYTLTVTVRVATSNYLFIFFTITFIPIMLFYYVRFGEIHSFLSNRIIIFSLRRSLAIIPMFLAISAFTFFGINFIGDPVEIASARVRFNKEQFEKTFARRFGLLDEEGNRIPVGVRYLKWVYDFFHGELGESYDTLIPIQRGLKGFLLETVKMQLTALTLAFVLSLVIGIMAAYYHRTLADSAISAFALLGLSMPIFVSGLLAILIFGGIGLGWFPVSGAHSLPSEIVRSYDCMECGRKPPEIWEQEFSSNAFNFSWWLMYLKVWWIYFRDAMRHLLLPVATLTFATMATFSRLTRSTMLEVMRQDYILAARANGLSERKVLVNHALRNVLLPLVTFLGISVGTILVGAPITETVFSYPGLGQKFITALFTLDVPVLMALTMVITLMILFANMITDIAYTYLDPRISL